MKYRIIGDIHGRTRWEKLVDIENKDIIYIYLGDFTDPYYGYEPGINYNQMVEQIKKVFDLKKKAPERVFILASNHDNQYWTLEGETNRFDRLNCNEIHKLFVENRELFYGVAYQIGEKYLISHAGVTLDWYTKKFKKDFLFGKTTLKEICENINDYYNGSDLNKKQFSFNKCVSKFSDYYGISSTHSPLWVRPTSLWENNLFGFESGIIQIVGHTPFEPITNEEKDRYSTIATFGTLKTPMTPEEIELGYYISDDNNNKCGMVSNNAEHVDIILCDCFFRETACVEIDENNLEWKKIKIDE